MKPGHSSIHPGKDGLQKCPTHTRRTNTTSYTGSWRASAVSTLRAACLLKTYGLNTTPRLLSPFTLQAPAVSPRGCAAPYRTWTTSAALNPRDASSILEPRCLAFLSVRGWTLPRPSYPRKFLWHTTRHDTWATREEMGDACLCGEGGALSDARSSSINGNP